MVSAEMIANMGFRPGTQEFNVDEVIADAHLAKTLNIAEGAKVITIERVRTADKIPVVYSLDMIPRVNCPRYQGHSESRRVPVRLSGTKISCHFIKQHGKAFPHQSHANYWQINCTSKWVPHFSSWNKRIRTRLEGRSCFRESIL